MNKVKPLLTIVTPSYNQGVYIQETLASLLVQGLKPGELQYIIVDACSTDTTNKVVRSYLPKLRRCGIDVTYIREKDRGQSDAINKGWRLAKGEIITYLNSDDFYEPYVLRRVIDAFQTHPSWKWAYGGWHIINKRGKLFASYQHTKFNGNALRTYAAGIGQPSCFYKRSLLKKVGLVNEELHLAMDYDLWLRFLRVGEPAMLPFVVSNMRYYADAKSAQFTMKHHFQAYRVARSYLDRDIRLEIQTFWRFIAGVAMIKLGRNISQQIESSS